MFCDCCTVIKCRLLRLVQIVFSYFVVHSSKIPLVHTTKVTRLHSLLFRQPDGVNCVVRRVFCGLSQNRVVQLVDVNHCIHVDLSPAMSNPRPSRRLCAAQFRFRCSKSSLHIDNLSLLWWSLIWHLWCRLSYVPFYHVCYHCSYNSNAFSTLGHAKFSLLRSK